MRPTVELGVRSNVKSGATTAGHPPLLRPAVHRATPAAGAVHRCLHRPSTRISKRWLTLDEFADRAGRLLSSTETASAGQLAGQCCEPRGQFTHPELTTLAGGLSCPFATPDGSGRSC